MNEREKRILKDCINKMVQVVIMDGREKFKDGFLDIFTEEDYNFYTNKEYGFSLEKVTIDLETGNILLDLKEE